MKKVVLLSSLLVGAFFSTGVFAEELKRGCVKDNPLVAGETDATLIQIYSQACDRKNKDNKNGYLAQAAQRFQQLGKNYKALQLVNELNAQGVQHSSLTDVKFMAGVGIANDALTQIRDKEVRYLSDEAYAPAIALNEAVKKAKPLSVIETKEEEKKVVQESRPRAQTTRSQPTRTTRKTTVRKTPPKTVKTVQKPTAPVKSQPKSPFAGLQ